MNESSNFYRWRPHPWHGLELGRRPLRQSTTTKMLFVDKLGGGPGLG